MDGIFDKNENFNLKLIAVKGMAYTDKVFCRTGHNVFN